MATIKTIGYCDKVISKYCLGGIEVYPIGDILDILYPKQDLNITGLSPMDTVPPDVKIRYGIDKEVHLLTRVGVFHLLAQCDSPQAADLANFLGLHVIRNDNPQERIMAHDIILGVFRDEEVRQRSLVGNYCVDFLFPQYNLIVDSVSEDGAADAKKWHALNKLGYCVVYFDPSYEKFAINPLLIKIADSIRKFVAKKDLT